MFLSDDVNDSLCQNNPWCPFWEVRLMKCSSTALPTSVIDCTQTDFQLISTFLADFLLA